MSSPLASTPTVSVEREVVLEAPREQVWDALTREAMLEEWLAPEVELDLREGGELTVTEEDGKRREGTVEVVEELERLAFRWWRGADGPSRVELRLDDVPGGTRLVVVESGLGAGLAPLALAGWSAGLRSLGLLAGRLVLAQMPPDAVGAVFSALADPTRRHLVETLSRRPTATPTALAAELPISRQAVAKHLAALVDAGLVAHVRSGREAHYRLTPRPLAEAATWMANVGGEWDDRLARLQALVEKDRG